MRKKIEFEWEVVFEQKLGTNLSETVRAKVFGGWIVTTTMSDAKKCCSSTVFVPDTEHGWIIVKNLAAIEIKPKEEALDF